MSEPKRYTGKSEGSLLGSPHWEHPEGEWVKWEDYARLLSENALVREESDRHYGLWVERGYQLAKLRKAGTEMGKHLPDTDAANRAYIDFEAEAGE